MNKPELDIVIPVYNEGENMLDVCRAFERHVKTPFRVFVCYDFDEDNTLIALQKEKHNFEIIPVKNRGKGAHGAIVTGLRATTAPAVLTFGADEANNAEIIDGMYGKFKEGNDIEVINLLLSTGLTSGNLFPLLYESVFLIKKSSLLFLFWIIKYDKILTYGTEEKRGRR